MKIASVQTPKDVNISKNTIETKPDEFTRELSRALNKESEVKKETTKLDSNDDEEEIETDLEDSLVAMINLTFVELKETEAITLDIDPSIIKEAPISIGAVNTSINEEKPISINEIKPNIENIENVESIGEVIAAVNKSMQVNKAVISSNTENLRDEIMPLLKDEESNEETLIAQKINISNSNNGQSEFFNKDENQHKDIPRKVETLDIKEVSAEVKPKEKLAANENRDVNFLEQTQMKNFNKISFETKIETQKPVLSNDNLQKVNDSIIQLMETTTEGNTNVLKVKLYPEDLGVVDVTLRMEEGKLTAKILVDNDYIKGLFTNRVNELNESLVKQNIHLEKINIDLNLNSNSNANSGFDLNQEGSFNQGRGNYSNRNQAKYFNREAVNTVVNETNIHESGAISILA